MRPVINTPEEDPATDMGNVHKKLVKIARVVPEISLRTDRQTNTQSDIVNIILRNCPVTTVLIHRLRDWLVLISRVINACTADITYHAIMAGAIY